MKKLLTETRRALARSKDAGQDPDNSTAARTIAPVTKVDFTKYDLVIGKKGLANGNAGIKYSLLRECSGAQLVLRVVFNQGLTTEAPNLTYHALVPKLAVGQDLKVDIEVNNR